jgi:glucose-6-phosphate isomerase
VCGFAEKMRAGACLGFSNLPITDVVNIGIGGSDLGPRMTTQALRTAATSPVHVHFVSNVDAWSLQHTSAQTQPCHHRFCGAKQNLHHPRNPHPCRVCTAVVVGWWLPADLLPRHLMAVTAKPSLALTQGFDAAHVFEFWDWVGGRYSIWSAIGLPLAIAIGAPSYRELLQGACDMDTHVQTATAQSNMPLNMALLGIWNRNFLGAESLHIAPYPSCLGMLVPYLQQMDMESNGKSVYKDGSAVQTGTSPVLWGGLGIDGQHAYFQMVHQGTHLVPTDFIGVTTEKHCPALGR